MSAAPKITAMGIADVNMPVATIFIIATGIADVINVCCYCNIVTFILK
jgi:hypothetical protein